MRYPAARPHTQGYLHLRGVLGSDEVAHYLGLVEDNKGRDIATINEDPSDASHQINRPLSRMIDADMRFATLLDHPVSAPYLTEFLGEGYRHIDNDLYFTYPGFTGGGWHRGVQAHPTGYVVDGQFICPMVKVFFCLTDVGPG